MEDEIEEEKPKYEITDIILGKGTSGEVFLCNNIEDKKQYAAKLISKNLLENEEKLLSIEDEILISTTCQHKNLVKVYDLIQIKEQKYLILEYCNGGDLLSALKNYRLKYGEVIEENIIRNIILDIFSGLKCLHDNNIIHHDIKPQNILLKYENEDDLNNINFSNCTFKITDFSASTNLKEKDESNVKVKGTPLYMEPLLFEKDVKFEVIENKKVDIWSLGILTYELLFNCNPFYNNKFDESSINDLIASFKRETYIFDFLIRKEISFQVVCFVNNCLQYKQDKRLDCEILQFSEFLTRDIGKFSFLNIDNLWEFFHHDYITNDKKAIILNIKDDRRLNEEIDMF
jgi:serine/threonine protein kinase